MFKNAIVFFFGILFLVLTTVPTIISVLKPDCDISVVFDLNEDDEQNEKNESVKDTELKFLQKYVFNIMFKLHTKTLIQDVYLKLYAPHYLELQSPPPENVV